MNDNAITFDAAMTAYVAALTATRAVCSLSTESVAILEGSRFCKITHADSSGSRFALSFVERATGDVYKAASWKAPAKGVRGNIFQIARGAR
jgi:hypothetical protein